MAIEIVGYTGYRLSKEIDVISSAILTHIRAGRNKPSTDVIIAFLDKFRHINGHWLLTGNGQPILEPESGGSSKVSYIQILHDIPVEDIVNYILSHEIERDFDKSKNYKLFTERLAQSKLIEKMKELEAKVDKALSEKNN